MTMSEERLVFFPSGGVSLAGVLAVPSKPNGFGVVIPWGAGAFPSSSPNGVRARLARMLADQGFHAFRFDYVGVGESEGEYKRPDMSTPRTDEIVAACEWLARQDLPKTIVIANCFGAWSALIAAPRIRGLAGLALVHSPVERDHHQVRAGSKKWRWWAKKLRRLELSKLRSADRRAVYGKLINARFDSAIGRTERKDNFSSAVAYVLQQAIPVLFLYGNDDFRADFESRLDRGLRTLIDQAGHPTRIVLTDQRLQGFASFESQQVLLDEVKQWVAQVVEHSMTRR